MINLLSPQYKIEITRNYYMRLGIVSVLFVIVLVLVAVVFLIPSYIAVSTEEKVKKDELTQLAQSRDPELDKISASIQSINGKLAVFSEPYVQASFPKEILAPILQIDVPGITIYEFFYTVVEPTKKTISIRGDAVSRENLLTFTEQLEKTGLFEKIDVPISNLLRGDNVSFGLDLKLKQ